MYIMYELNQLLKCPISKFVFLSLICVLNVSSLIQSLDEDLFINHYIRYELLTCVKDEMHLSTIQSPSSIYDLMADKHVLIL